MTRQQLTLITDTGPARRSQREADRARAAGRIAIAEARRALAAAKRWDADQPDEAA